MAYQPSWVIQCQSYSCKTAAAVLFNPQLGNKGVHTFPKSISSKVNEITRLVFELAYFEATVQHFSYEDSPFSIFCEICIYKGYKTVYILPLIVKT